MIVSLYPGRPFQSIIIPLWGICWQSYDMCIVSLKFKRCFNVSTLMNYEASRLVSLTLLKLSRLINFEVSRLAILDLSLLWILSSGSVAGSGVTVGGPRVPHVRVPWTSKHLPNNLNSYFFRLRAWFGAEIHSTLRKSVASSFSMKIHSLKHEWK